MRLSLMTAVCLVSVALLAGCSNTQSTSNLPSTSFAAGARAIVPPQLQTVSMADAGNMSQTNLLKLQAEGKLVGPFSRHALERALQYLRHHPHAQMRVHPQSKGSDLWVTNTGYSYLLAMTVYKNGGTSQTAAINTAENGCYYPVTVKTDAHANVWTACESNNGNQSAGVEQEYSSGGQLVATYDGSAQGCTPGWSCYSFTFDGGSDGMGHVYLEQTSADEYYCSGSTCAFEYLDPGFMWWNEGSPSSSPTFISLPYGNPVRLIFYMATDSSGNIWFDYLGCGSATCGGYGLAEITNPTSNPQFVSIVSPYYNNAWGGVSWWCLLHSKICPPRLAVTNPSTTYTALYEQGTSGLQLVGLLGPTLEGFDGLSEPIAGGINKSGTQLAQGDAFGWVDITNTASNKQSVLMNLNFLPSVGGASWAKSGSAP